MTSGQVKIADNFRDNLIIDRYDPLLIGMRASKQKHMRSENSEDAVSWNVFRSLRQIDASHWVPALVQEGLASRPDLPVEDVAVYLWASVRPPSALLRTGDEGNSEVDILIVAPTWVWAIEAKYQSDISTGTKTRPERDQVLRNIDVGSYYAGVRDFYFSLLIQSESKSPLGVAAVKKYQDFDLLRKELAGHRPDGLKNLQEISILTWGDLVRVLRVAAAGAAIDESLRPAEAGYATRALEWLAGKGIS